jgi:superfamily II DNA/RNA helicase
MLEELVSAKIRKSLKSSLSASSYEPKHYLSFRDEKFIMTDFAKLGLPHLLVESLKLMKITSPTPIQTATIPVALTGQDIFASAQTGSGKTIAYSAPLIIKLLGNRSLGGLILTPTRELATQVFDAINLIMGKSPAFQTALLIGGAPMGPQMAALKRRPQLIVGTPGRIADHLDRGTLKLHETRFLVIDEADRLLDMGFGVQLDQIAEYLPSVRQTLMFSATMPPNIERLSKKHLNNPQRICIDASIQSAPKIKQEIIRTTHADKFTQLLQQLEEREGSVLIFTRTRRGADRLARDIRDKGHRTEAIHGDLVQRRRDRVIQAFRSSAIRILVATDIAARGIDIPHIMHVINYDLPQCPEDYIHRIGRTARAGAEGNALCLLTSADHQKWREITRLIQPHSAANEKAPPHSNQDRPSCHNKRSFFKKKHRKPWKKKSF